MRNEEGPFRFAIGARTFNCLFLRMKNGSFLALSEGEEPRLGALTIGVKMGDRVNTMVAIPPRFGGVLHSMLAELVAGLVGGIAVTSLFVARELGVEEARSIIGWVREILASKGAPPLTPP